MTTVLWVIGAWLVGGSAVVYVLLTWDMHRTERAGRADLDDELRDLIEQDRTQ